MGIRSLLSFGLILAPVAVTIGVLLGLDAYRTTTGKSPLFVDNSVHNDVYCQKSYGIHPQSKGEEYTLNPNQWNWDQGDPGALCMHVTSFGNGSYSSNNTAPPFHVTWQYPRGPADDPVHAFPNIKLDTRGVMPVQLSKISNINVDLEWSYGVGSEPVAATDIAAVTAAQVSANVAIDMFLDSDATKAQDASKAAFEVMVWLGYIEPSVAQPVGMLKGVVTTTTLGSNTFSLYYGQNQFGQNVLTWYPSTILTEFTADLKPLIDKLYTITGIQVPAASDYLGYMGMGSEAYYSLTSNVTFSVPNLSMEVKKS